MGCVAQTQAQGPGDTTILYWDKRLEPDMDFFGVRVYFLQNVVEQF